MTSSHSRKKRVVARIQISAVQNYSELEASAQTGVSPELLRYYRKVGLLGRERAMIRKDPIFDDSALFEIRRIERLRTEFGVSRRALPLFCELFRRVEHLQNEVRYLRGP